MGLGERHRRGSRRGAGAGGLSRRCATRAAGAETVPASVALALSAEPGAGSEFASISTSGRYVAFFSPADNLVEGETNDRYDGFVYDTQTAITTGVSVDSDGVEDTVDSFEDGSLCSWDVVVGGPPCAL